MSSSSSPRISARRDIYRKISVLLGLISGVLALITWIYAYFSLVTPMFISIIALIVGSILIWIKKPILGGILILVGTMFGGYLGLPLLLWQGLATVFGDWAYGLPLLPLGLILPVASSIFAFLSQEHART